MAYPLGDVKGFVENKGANYLYSGYWKVYGDVYNTMRQFRKYDLARKMVLEAVISGRTIREIVV